MEIRTTVDEMTRVLELCQLVASTSSPFTPISSYAIIYPSGIVVANSLSCVLFLRAFAVNAPHAVVIPIRPVRELVSLFSPKEKVVIQSSQPNKVSLIVGGKAEFTTIPPEQFPQPDLPEVSGICLNGPRFSQALDRCIPAAQDAYEPRRVVCLFTLSQRPGIWCLGTDGFRAIIDVVPTQTEQDICKSIPVSSCNVLTRFCRADSTVFLQLGERGELIFSNQIGTLVVQTAQVIPVNFEELLGKIEDAQRNSSKYLVREMASPCNIVHVVARERPDPEKNLAVFETRNSSLVVSSQTSEHSVRVVIPTDVVGEKNAENVWILNLQFMKSVLSSLAEQEILLHVPNPDASFPAWVLTPKDDKFPLGMLLPVVKRKGESQ